MKKETRGRKPIKDPSEKRAGITVTAKLRHHEALKPLIEKMIAKYERKQNTIPNN
jgi:hypothetical protein